MSKIKTTLKEPDIDNRLLDDRGVTPERQKRAFYVQGQSPVERAVARGTISEQHGRAAQKFNHHWRRSGCASLGSNWKAEPSAYGCSDHIPMSKTELEAFDRRTIRAALAAIHEKMGDSGMSRDAIKCLFSVVCDENPFEETGKLIFGVNGISGATLAIRYVKSALRVLSIKWNIS